MQGRQGRRQIQEEVRAAAEEGRSSRAAGLSKQGPWTRWEEAMDWKVTWTDLWQAEPHRNTFLIQNKGMKGSLDEPTDIYRIDCYC